MSDDAPLVTRDLPELSRLSLRDLRRDAGGALDAALLRVLEEDQATTETSSGFQSRI